MTKFNNLFFKFEIIFKKYSTQSQANFIHKINKIESTATASANNAYNNNNPIPNEKHIPVMKHKVIELFKKQDCKKILDLTFGGGGHTRALLENLANVDIYALDRDPDAYKSALELAAIEPRVKPMLGKFSEVADVLKATYGVMSVDGALIDAGVSSMQFNEAERGFALSKDGPLDMRMDKDRNPNQIDAYDVVNRTSEAHLYQIIKKYGEEKNARFIARAIVDHRHSHGDIRTTKQLAAVVATAFSNQEYKQDKLQRPAHVATKTFQAIRIFVNNELNELDLALQNIYKLLVPNGICVAMTFHSLEDRIVKRHFHGIYMNEDPNRNIRDIVRKAAKKCLDRNEIEKIIEKKWTLETRKIVIPPEEEILINPRSRSAKLRYAFKTNKLF